MTTLDDPAVTAADITACSVCSASVVVAVNTRTGSPATFDAEPAPDGVWQLRKGHLGPTARPLSTAQQFGQRTLYRPHKKCKRRRGPTGAPHAFEVDDDIPADPYNGRRWCRCGVAGEAGDERHPAGALPLVTSRPAADAPAAGRN